MHMIRRIFPDFAIFIESTFHLALSRIGLRHKKVFRVIVEGSPLWWTGDDGNPEEMGGFFTTRWAGGWSREEAIARVVEMVQGEARSFARNPARAPLRLRVEQCAQEKGIVRYAGGGFSFWGEAGFPPDDDHLH
jgi:hypothetical protein